MNNQSINNSITDVAVSVIMPVYNSAAFLHESIQSILEQSFTAFEFIIINDGSTDGSEKIINDYALQDHRIKFINRKENKKIVYTLNEGVSAARGKYIARMDADDIAHPQRLSAQVDHMEKNPGIYVLGTSYTVFTDEGIKKTVVRNYPSVYMAFKFISDTCLCHPSIMVRKEALEKMGGYKQKEAEDFDLFARISHSYKCANLERSYIMYREHAANRSFEYSEKIKKDAYSTFEQNYAHFITDKKFIERFYHFHSNLKGNVLYLPKYIWYSMAIQNKIRKSYSLQVTDREFYSSVIIFYRHLFSGFFRKIKNITA